MAETLIFHYRKQDTLLGKTHPLVKAGATLALCISVFSLSLPGILVILSAFVLLAVSIRLPIGSFRREIVYFSILLAMILLTEYLVAFVFLDALAAGLRFVCVILLGLLIADTTAPDELARTLGSFLDRIPFINGWAVASSVELTLCLLPMIFDAAQQASEARKARLQGWKHPLRAIVSLSGSILSLLLDKAEDFANALEARHFDYAKSRPSMRLNQRDLWFSLGVLVLLLLAFVV